MYNKKIKIVDISNLFLSEKRFKDVEKLGLLFIIYSFVVSNFAIPLTFGPFLKFAPFLSSLLAYITINMLYSSNDITRKMRKDLLLEVQNGLYIQMEYTQDELIEFFKRIGANINDLHIKVVPYDGVDEFWKGTEMFNIVYNGSLRNLT